MKCERCGTVVTENEQYCHGCGNQIVRSANSLNNNQYMNSQPSNNESESKLGTISLIIGIIAMVASFRWPLLGLILSIVGLVLASKYKKQTNKKTPGKVLNIIGLILSILAGILKILLVVGIGILGMFFGEDSDVEVNTESSLPSSTNSSLVCSYKGENIEENIIMEFKNEKPATLKVEMSGKEAEEDAEIPEGEGIHYLSFLSYSMMVEQLKNEPGINGSVLENNSTTKILLEVDFDKISDTVKEEHFDGISSVTIDDMKNEYTGYGYSCK